MTPRERTVTSGLRSILKVGRVPVLVEQEVEAAHLVGAVVRAVARPHAAVVDHVVQAFVAVDGRRDRAHHLARRVLALHARRPAGGRCRGSRAGPRSSGRRGSSASRARAPPGPCRRPGRCSPTGTPSRRRCSRRRRSCRSSCPRRGPCTRRAGRARARARARVRASGPRARRSRTRRSSRRARCGARAPAPAASPPPSSGPACRRCGAISPVLRTWSPEAAHGAPLVRSR